MNKFDTHQWNEYLMKCNKLSVGLNMPQALASVGSGDTEMKHGLPPYHRRKAFLVDEYPACPKDWMRSTGRIKSYFVPIIENNGLWLDFNETLNEIPQHVGIVVSVQGVNAVTGQPCNDPQLEQYRDECPKHKKPFGPDRLCKECGYKWPKQNYIASSATPDGELWFDGFRAEDGKIRQFVLTEKTARGVANAIIGKDRVFALGISYFLTKEKRQSRPPARMRGVAMAAPGCSTHTVDYSVNNLCDTTSWTSCASGVKGKLGSSGPPGAAAPDSDDDSAGSLMFFANNSAEYEVDNTPLLKAMVDAGALDKSALEAPKKSSGTKGLTKGLNMSKGLTRGITSLSTDSGVKYAASATKLISTAAEPAPAAHFAHVDVKAMEIAAGASIDQQVHDDPLSLDAYCSEPEAIIVINYCSEAEAEAIIAQGKVDLSGSKEGFLKNVPTGNPV